MKKTLLPTLMLICCALPEISAAHAQAANQSAQAAASPEAVVRSFYAYYLGELNKDNWKPLKNRREALKYLTPEFHRRIPRIIEEQMVDIIICAQDFDAKWAESFTVGRPTVRAAKATTVVRLPPFGGSDDSPAIKIKVTLVKRGGAWKIDSTDCVN